MTTAHVFIATSLDGFIARPDGAIDWLDRPNTAGEDHGYEAFMGAIDGIFMGRKTFEVVLGFDPWPYDKPLIVLSKTLKAQDVPQHLASQVSVANSISDALAESRHQGWDRAYVDGGRTIRGFLAEGLIKDMVITRVPVLLGDGVILFGPLAADVLLQHIETRAFPSGLVQSRYLVLS